MLFLTYFDLSLAFQDFLDRGLPFSHSSQSVKKKIMMTDNLKKRLTPAVNL